MMVSSSKNRAEKLAESMAGKSNIPSHNSGSYININASNATKRELLEQELSRLKDAGAYVTTVEQSDELTKRQKNVEHQLQMLDAAAGNEPKAYTGNKGNSGYQFNHSIDDYNVVESDNLWEQIRQTCKGTRYETNCYALALDLTEFPDGTRLDSDRRSDKYALQPGMLSDKIYGDKNEKKD